jgi:glutathione S-transferase
MYTVVGTPKSRCLRVIWCLEELGLDYDLNPAPPRSDEMRKVNPSGKVPALVVDGEAIIDSTAICQYLADKHGALTHPAGAIARARQDSMTHLALDEFDSVCWTAAKHKLILPEDQRIPAIIDRCGYEYSRSLKKLSERLGDNEFAAGDMFTVPDIILTHCANWAGFMFDWEDPTGNVAAYLERVRARPAYLRAMEIRNAA